MKKNPIKIFLILNVGICYLFGLLEFIFRNGIFYQILGIGFTFIPVMCVAFSKRITGEKAKYHLSLKVWRNVRAWLFSAIVPGIMVALGATLYFVIFPKEYSGIFKYGMRFGSNAELTINNPLILAGILVLLAAVMIPVQLLELGKK